MVRERAPYTVRCSGLDRGVATFREYAAARSYALGIANREDVQCAITDRFGSSEIVVRSGPVDPRRREYDPYRGRPFFHPNPEHPRSRKRFLRNEPQGWTPGVGPSQTQIRPEEFFGMDPHRYQVVCDGIYTIAPALSPSFSEARGWAIRNARAFSTRCRVVDHGGCVPGVTVFRVDRRGAPPLEGLGQDDTSSLLAAIAPPAILFGAVLFLIRRRDGDELAAPPNGIAQHQRGRRASRKLYGSAVLTAQAAGSMRKLALDTRDRGVAREAVELQRQSRRLLEMATRADPGFVQRKLSR